MAIHQTAPMRVVHLWDRVRATSRYQGDWSELNDYMASLTYGMQVEGPEKETIAKYVPADQIILTGGGVNRMNGEVGEMEVEITGFRQVCSFGFDFTPVSRPILCFRWNGESNEAVETRVQNINMWQDSRNLDRVTETEYRNFQYYTGDRSEGVKQLTGHDLDLARKILRGVESFDQYIPVITRTRTSAVAFTDSLNAIGHPDTPSVPGGWETWNENQLLAAVALKATWIKTVDVTQMNPDSSFTRREQWTGFDELDIDLYPPLT